MKFLGVILASVLLLTGQSLADSCKTCRGSDCLAEEISELECTKFIPELPFEIVLSSNNVRENSEYGCLQLEYFDSDSLQQIQQCILSSDLESYCDILKNTLKVKSCTVTSSGTVRSIRSAIKPILIEQVNEEEPPEEVPSSTTTTTGSDSDGSSSTPTDAPTNTPTDAPTNTPTNAPTNQPTNAPTDDSGSTVTGSTTTQSDEDGNGRAFHHVISLASLLTVVLTLLL